MFHDVDTLRFTTAGSVDDGKSTLIGRLLFDTHAILDDQIRALEGATRRHGHAGNAAALDLSLLTDGLIAEREQGITIDVAYRYFTSGKRRYIIADTPGHEQYTRNMVTGASTADLSVVLIDASRGLTAQSRRHAVIASLLGIQHLIIAVNKMDLVGYKQSVFDTMVTAFRSFLDRIGVENATFIPLSALHGDMVVTRHGNMPWYAGQTLLEALESTPLAEVATEDFRFPVQSVSRAKFGLDHSQRGYMGRVEGGVIKVGDEVQVLPSREPASVSAIHTYDGLRQQASEGQSITLILDRQIDISRGDMIVKRDDSPRVASSFASNLCWLDRENSQPGRRYWLKHSTKITRAVIESIDYRLDVNSLDRERPVHSLTANDIASVVIKTQQPLVMDRYADNRATGSFVLIDDTTHRTVAAGMIL
jgi:sulfate adenylyltransferase subunit 1